MAEPSTVFPLSSNVNTFHIAIESSSHQNSSSSKKTRGRPHGSRNKPKLPFVINQDNKHSQKPIIIQVPKNFDVIDSVVQFAHHYQVSLVVLSAIGSIFNATIRHTLDTSAFLIYGPFNLVSLNGSYINNNIYVSSSSSTNLGFHYSFRISFCSISGQSFTGIVGGKVIAADDVNVVAIIFNNHENYKVDTNDSGEEPSYMSSTC